MKHTLYTFQPLLAGNPVRVAILEPYQALVFDRDGRKMSVSPFELRLAPGAFRPEPVDHPDELLQASKGEFWSCRQVERFFQLQKEHHPADNTLVPALGYDQYNTV